MFPFVGLARRGGNLITGSVSASLSAMLAGGTVGVGRPQFSAAMAKIAASGSLKRTVKISAMSAALSALAASGTGQVITVLDSYDTTTTGYTTLSSTKYLYAGQKFTLAGAKHITATKFQLAKQGSPTGNMTAELFAYSGGVTGAALAVSNAVAASSLTTSPAWHTFQFAPAYSASAATYAIFLHYTGGDNDNLVMLSSKWYGDHAGNQCSSYVEGTWGEWAEIDDLFYLYGY